MAMLWQLLLQGGGTAAGVATVAILLNIRSDNRRMNRRMHRVERYIWPEVFGEDENGDF